MEHLKKGSGRFVVYFVVGFLFSVLMLLLHVKTCRKSAPLNLDCLDLTCQREKGDFLGSMSEEGETQENRIGKLLRFCKNNKYGLRVFNQQTEILYYYSVQYNVSLCKVPKVGGSFWTQAFHHLNLNASKMNKTKRLNPLRTFSRNRLHREENFDVKFDSVQRQKSRIILNARNPYTRLFSAYMDKIFLPLQDGLVEPLHPKRFFTFNSNMTINSKSGNEIHADRKKWPCTRNTTFQYFLNYILSEAVCGHKLDIHWAPIYSLCRPCETSPFKLVKMETFSQDVENVLDDIKVETRTKSVILHELHNRRIQDTLPGIIYDSFKLQQKKCLVNCMHKSELALRLWKTFQVNGYIRDEVPFPLDLRSVDSGNFNHKNLTDTILETIKRHPLSPTESHAQRQKALTSAYNTVNEHTILLIQSLYYQDFKLFGYSMDPPR